MIFLAEAFTRPKVMYRLAKLGFTQSYTYFTWRNTQAGADGVLRPSSPRPPVREFFRPNFWPNTPDILTEQLQTGGRPDVRARGSSSRRRSARATASTARPSSCGARAARAGQRGVPATRRSTSSAHWDLERPDSLRDADRARQPRSAASNPALQRERTPALPRRSTTTSCSATASAPPTARNVDPRASVNLDPHDTPGGLGRAATSTRSGIDRRRAVPGARPADRRALPLAGRAQLRRARSRRASPAHVFRVPARPRPRRDFEYFHARAARRDPRRPRRRTTRSGTRTRSSTSSTSARSTTATATASATSAA